MLFQAPSVLTDYTRSPVGHDSVFFSRNPGVVWICECIYFYVFLRECVCVCVCVCVCLFRAAPEAYGGSQAGVK